MTSILGTVNTERRAEGVRMVIAAGEKVGKTTFGASAPAPLLIPLEVGYGGVNIPKSAMLQEFAQVEALMTEILAQAQAGTFPYKTLIFDSATALERQIHDSILYMDSAYSPGNKKAVTMESALGGYGKAYTYANEKFSRFLKQCDILAVYGGINIILTCHVFAAKLIDPNAGEYDSWDLRLHSPKNQKTFGKREMITEWADIIGFLYEPIYVTKGDTMSKGVSANKGRMLGLSRTPSYIAGNRYRIEGEVPIPADDGWNHFAQALYQSSGIDVFKR